MLLKVVILGASSGTQFHRRLQTSFRLDFSGQSVPGSTLKFLFQPLTR